VITKADTAAKESKGKLYEYDRPLGIGDDHRIGKLIADYSLLLIDTYNFEFFCS
jgi:hypothetical protein